MHRVLIVANQTLGGEQVLETVRARMADGACHFHVLVPATNAAQLDPAYLAGAVAAGDEPEPPSPVAAGDRRAAQDVLEYETGAPPAGDHPATDVREDPGRSLARLQLRHELQRLRELGADASGEVGVSDPLDAIRMTLHREPFNEIVLSTLPPGISRWVAMDLPSRVRRAFKLPVTHVSGLARQP